MQCATAVAVFLRPKTCTDCKGPLDGIAAGVEKRSSPRGTATGKGKRTATRPLFRVCAGALSALKGFLTFHHLQSCSLLDPLLPKAFSISIFPPEPTARSHSGFPDSRFRVLLPSATYLLPESFPRILFLLAPPESTFRFHQNFLPFSLLFPESFSSQKSIPKPLSWDPSPHILFFSESLSTQGPCFSPVVPPRIFLFSGSTTPGNRLLPNLSSQPTVPRTTP